MTARVRLFASILLGAMLINLVRASADIPNVESITFACDPSGCLGGTYITIQGASLLDDNGAASVTLAPTFYVYPPMLSIDCPIEYDASTSTFIFCQLPDVQYVPASYTGVSLMVNVSNANGEDLSGGTVMYAPPLAARLYGCAGINSTALDRCAMDGAFEIFGQFPPNVSSLNVALNNEGSKIEWSCPFFDDAHTQLQCTFPTSRVLEFGWYTWCSVQVEVNGMWSEPITPGIRFIEPAPTIDSTSNDCWPAGDCAAGMILTINGEYLIDGDSFASVSIAPSFDVIDPTNAIDCPVDLDSSTLESLYCSLSDVPDSFLGLVLMVQVTNANGVAPYQLGVIYTSPSSTGSQPYPSIDDDSSTSTMIPIVALVAVFVVAVVISLVLRNRVNRRRMLTSGAAAPLINNQPAPPAPHANASASVASAPAQAASAPPPVYSYHYPQQSVHYPATPYQPAQYPVAQYPVAQHPPAYSQYSAAGYQPTAPSVYPQARQYPAY